MGRRCERGGPFHALGMDLGGGLSIPQLGCSTQGSRRLTAQAVLPSRHPVPAGRLLTGGVEMMCYATDSTKRTSITTFHALLAPSLSTSSVFMMCVPLAHYRVSAAPRIGLGRYDSAPDGSAGEGPCRHGHADLRGRPRGRPHQEPVRAGQTIGAIKRYSIKVNQSARGQTARRQV